MHRVAWGGRDRTEQGAENTKSFLEVSLAIGGEPEARVWAAIGYSGSGSCEHRKETSIESSYALPRDCLCIRSVSESPSALTAGV